MYNEPLITCELTKAQIGKELFDHSKSRLLGKIKLKQEKSMTSSNTIMKVSKINENFAVEGVESIFKNSSELLNYDNLYNPNEIVSWEDAITFEGQEDFVIPGLAMGTTGCLVSPGGLGKTHFATQLALQIAIGHGGYKRGGVIYFSAEDTRHTMSLRMRNISKAFDIFADIPPNDISRNIYMWPCSGQNTDIITGSEKNENILQHKVKAIVSKKDWKDSPRLLILDTLNMFSKLDENSNDDMSVLIQGLRKINVETGLAVLVIHHVTKTAALNGSPRQQDARGASTIVDNARYSSSLYSMTDEEAKKFGIRPNEMENYICHIVTKINFGKRPEPQWYRRDEDTGVLLPIDLMEKSKPSVKSTIVRGIKEG